MGLSQEPQVRLSGRVVVLVLLGSNRMLRTATISIMNSSKWWFTKKQNTSLILSTHTWQQTNRCQPLNVTVVCHGVCVCVGATVCVCVCVCVCVKINIFVVQGVHSISQNTAKSYIIIVTFRDCHVLSRDVCVCCVCLCLCCLFLVLLLSQPIWVLALKCINVVAF